MDAAAEYPEAGHDFVPVQVGALQVAQSVRTAEVALPSVQQTPVVKGHQVTWRTRREGVRSGYFHPGSVYMRKFILVASSLKFPSKLIKLKD